MQGDKKTSLSNNDILPNVVRKTNDGYALAVEGAAAGAADLVFGKDYKFAEMLTPSATVEVWNYYKGTTSSSDLVLSAELTYSDSTKTKLISLKDLT